MSAPTAEVLFQVEECGPATVVRVGLRDLGEDATAQLLGERLCGLVEPNCRLVLNLSRVERLGGCMISRLLVLFKAVQAAGGRLVLTEPIPVVREQFRLSRLDLILLVRSPEASALLSLQGPRS